MFAILTISAVLLTAALAGCGDSHQPRSGESTSAYEALDYDLTSENYRKWVQANALLDTAGVAPSTRLSTLDPSDDEIDAMIEALENDPRASAMLDSADISAEDHVLTTIALAQSWDAVNAPGTVEGALDRNVDFVRTQPVDAAPIASRPTTRYVDDDRPRNRGKGKAKGKWKRRGGKKS